MENWADINFFWIVWWIWIGLLFWYYLAKLNFYGWIKKQRKQAVKQSKAVTLWYVNEKIAPILPNFPYNFKDLMFMWKWVDYVVFDGLSEWHVHQIVFLELKSWSSRLNKNEKLIKQAVDSGKVKYKVLRINV